MSAEKSVVIIIKIFRAGSLRGQYFSRSEVGILKLFE